MRFEAIQGVVYDRELDKVVHDVNRLYPHVRENERVAVAQGCAARLNNNERSYRTFENMVRGNTGML